MIYSVHHTHKRGVTLTVLHKDLSNANHWFAGEGHAAAKEIAQHAKGNTVHYFIEVTRELIDLGDED